MIKTGRKTTVKSRPARTVTAPGGELPPGQLKGGATVDLSILGQMVGSVGFPIVIALLAAYYIKYLGDKNTETVNNLNSQIIELNNRQNDQLDKMSDAISEMSKSIAVLNTTVAKELTK